MARRKPVPFPPWTTTTENGIEKKYIRVGITLLQSESFLKLSDKAKTLYLYMLFESGGHMEFKFPWAKAKQICSKESFQRAKAELIEEGFIVEKQNNANRRKANVYAFSTGWK